MPEYFTNFYKSDDKEINLKNNEEIKLPNGMLYIRPKNPNDIEDTIFQRNKTDKNNKIEEKEKEKIEISENTTFVDKIFSFFKDVVNKIKKIDAVDKIKKIEIPISIAFFSSDNNLPYSCIPRIDVEYPDLSYDYMDKE